MSERPFMQLFVSDFVGDTMPLSTEQIGAYLLLLMAMWNGDGRLPNEPAKLARVAKVPIESWATVWVDLASYFTIDEGFVTQERLTRELAKFARKSAARSVAGKLGAEAKALKNKKPTQAIAQQMHKHSPEPYKKEGNSVSVPTEKSASLVDVNRHVHPDLFARCVALTEPVAKFIEHKSFPAAVVDQARREMSH